jgi:hypothetical protein
MCGRRALVHRVRVGVQDAHGDRVHAGVDEHPGFAVEVVEVDVDHDGAVGADAFGHLAAEPPWDERSRLLEEEVVDLGPVPARDLEDVPEATSRDQADARPDLLDDRVQCERAAVDQLGGDDGSRRPVVAGEELLGQAVLEGGLLVDGDRARRLVQEHVVDERAPDVDAIR